MLKLMLPPEADQYRVQIRAWLEGHPNPSPQDLAEAGYVAPHWPEPWGRDASPVEQIVIDEAFREGGVRRPQNVIGIGWAGPTIVHAGTEEQKKAYLPGILDGSVQWCQLFSEPGSGSDLASLRTRAVKKNGDWVVDGQKIWTSGAGSSRYGILLARTDTGAPKHRGISYFICPMDADGIEIRPIKEMTGGSTFNEVFMTAVRIPGENLVGDEGQGWELAKVTLANERVSLSEGGAMWGYGPKARDLLDLVRDQNGVLDEVLRDRLVSVWLEGEILEVLRHRMVQRAIQGGPPGPEASVRKIIADIHGQKVFRMARDLAGTSGMLAEAGPLGLPAGFWEYGFLFSPALTIGGGTAEVQKGVIGERILGLPREPDASVEQPWSESGGN